MECRGSVTRTTTAVRFAVVVLALAGGLGLVGCTPTPASDPAPSASGTPAVEVAGELVTVKGTTQPTVCGVKIGIIGVDESGVRLGWEPGESETYAIGDVFSPRSGCTVRVHGTTPPPADSDEEGDGGTVVLDVVES